jgi:beta-glucosidase
VNGTYSSDNHHLLQDILRKEWGFEGLIMSDWVGTYSTVEAMNAGLDLEMPAPSQYRGKLLVKAVNEGKVSERVLDARAKKVIELVLKTRRMDDPEDKPELYHDNKERDEFIASAAAEGIILLKNENNVLPLKKGAKIAVIGQFAADPPIMGGGSARVPVDHLVSPIEGLKAAGVDITYEPGVPVYGAVPLPLPSILSRTNSTEAPGKITKPVRIEWFNGSSIGTNPVKDEFIANPEYQIKEKWPTFLDRDFCTRMTFDMTPETSGPHIFSVVTTGTADLYVNGEKVFHRKQEPVLQREAFYFFRPKLERLVTFDMVANQRYSIVLDSWATPQDIAKGSIGGEVVQGSAVAFVEHVDVPGRISDAAKAAASHDVAIVFTGLTPEFESEGFDRESMDLRPQEYDMVQAVAAANPNTILVNASGSAVTLTQVYERVAGLVQVFYPGQESGTSIARILTGAVNPSGRLPVTWPRKLEDNPSHGNWPGENDVIHYREGIFVGYRHYEKNKIVPLFPFGFGLSYTTFSISELDIKKPGIVSKESGVDLSCTITNTGAVAGKVVVQFYVRRLTSDSKFTRAVKELKAFQKPYLKPGASVQLQVSLDKYAVSCYDVDSSCWFAEEGEYEVQAGFSSADIVASAAFEVSQGFTWTGL